MPITFASRGLTCNSFDASDNGLVVGLERLGFVAGQPVSAGEIAHQELILGAHGDRFLVVLDRFVVLVQIEVLRRQVGVGIRSRFQRRATSRSLTASFHLFWVK